MPSLRLVNLCLVLNFCAFPAIRIIECPVTEGDVYGEPNEALRFRSFEFPLTIMGSNEVKSVAFIEVQGQVPASFVCERNNGETLPGQLHLDSSQQPLYENECNIFTLIFPPLTLAIYRIWTGWDMQIFYRRRASLCLLDRTLDFDANAGVSRLMIGTFGGGSVNCFWEVRTRKANEAVKLTMQYVNSVDPQTVLELLHANEIIDRVTGYSLNVRSIIRLESRNFTSEPLTISLSTSSRLLIIVGLYEPNRRKQCDYEMPVGLLNVSTYQGYVFEPLNPLNVRVPVKMQSNQFCSWTMWAPTGYTLSLRILHYQMEAADGVILQTGTMTHEVCSPLTLFVSSGDMLNFALETDDEGTLGGIAMLIAVTKCEDFTNDTYFQQGNYAEFGSETTTFLPAAVYCPREIHYVSVLRNESLFLEVVTLYNILPNDEMLFSAGGEDFFKVPILSPSDCIDRCAETYRSNRLFFYSDRILFSFNSTKANLIDGIAYRDQYYVVYVIGHPVPDAVFIEVSSFYLLGIRDAAKLEKQFHFRGAKIDSSSMFLTGLAYYADGVQYGCAFKKELNLGDGAIGCLNNNPEGWELNTNEFVFMQFYPSDRRCYSYLFVAEGFDQKPVVRTPRIVEKNAFVALRRGSSTIVASNDLEGRRGFVLYPPSYISKFQNCRFEAENSAFGKLYVDVTLRCSIETQYVQQLMYLNVDIISISSSINTEIFIQRKSLEIVRFGFGDQGFWSNTQKPECQMIPFVSISTKLALNFEFAHLKLRNTTIVTIVLRAGEREIQHKILNSEAGTTMTGLCYNGKLPAVYSLAYEGLQDDDEFMIHYVAVDRLNCVLD